MKKSHQFSILFNFGENYQDWKNNGRYWGDTDRSGTQWINIKGTLQAPAPLSKNQNTQVSWIVGSKTQSEIITAGWRLPNKRKLQGQRSLQSLSKVFRNKEFSGLRKTKSWLLTEPLKLTETSLAYALERRVNTRPFAMKTGKGLQMYFQFESDNGLVKSWGRS